MANHGWLKSAHSFSFASYYNPERMGFGLLRVLNDDQIAPSTGFDTHPHKDMEIVSVPISGALKHKDNQGNSTIIHQGEVQIMSAGTGVAHSEYNHSKTEQACFLQIWVLPEKLGIQPRYEQMKFNIDERKNNFQLIVSPLGTNLSGVKINQQAYFSLIDLEKNNEASYKLYQSKNGVYLFILEGKATVARESLNSRDALTVENSSEFNITATNHLQALVIEVPLG